MPPAKRKKSAKSKEAKFDKLHYKILVLLIVVWILNYVFFTPTMIGHDHRYALFVFWIPTMCGVVAIGFYRRKFLLDEYATYKKSFGIVLLFLFYLAQGFLFAYVSAGQIAEITWTVINQRIASQNQIETTQLPVSRFFYHRGRVDVEFIFNQRHEEFTTRHRNLVGYEEVSPKDFLVKITARKGIWNHYIVDHWEIVKNPNLPVAK